APPLSWRRNWRCSASRVRSSSSRASLAWLSSWASAAAGMATAATGAAISAPDLRNERRSVAESLSISCCSGLGEELVDVELAGVAGGCADRGHAQAVLAAVIADAGIVHRAHVDEDRTERAVARLLLPAREIELVADLPDIAAAAQPGREMARPRLGN